MTTRGRGRPIVAGMIVLTAALAAAGGWAKLDNVAAQQALKSASLTSVRQQALHLFPPGSRLDDAASRLADIGFDCQTMQHFLADTSAPSLLCASNGRGYPDYPAVNLTLITRNGLIADIDVWNVMVRADDDPEDVDMSATGSIRARSTDVEPDGAGLQP